MVSVNDHNTSALPMEAAVRVLTLAEWPRNLHFQVPPKKIEVTYKLEMFDTCEVVSLSWDIADGRRGG
jgi:hypothetical protein